MMLRSCRLDSGTPAFRQRSSWRIAMPRGSDSTGSTSRSLRDRLADKPHVEQILPQRHHLLVGRHVDELQGKVRVPVPERGHDRVEDFRRHAERHPEAHRRFAFRAELPHEPFSRVRAGEQVPGANKQRGTGRRGFDTRR
jgi:hypothetical protein